ncbi:MAG: cyclophilin-like fold protein [Eubacteriales bacterium]|nr:cyclophilin-like fold protein [Eubacteriales bacterium]
MKRVFGVLLGLLLAFCLTACGGGQAIPEPANEAETEEQTVTKLNVQIGGAAFTATLEENPAADAFAELLQSAPVIITMRDYSGFEKVGALGATLPADDSQLTTHAGDIVLYGGDQIVLFYGSNSWSYTRLGKVDDLSGWEDALDGDDVSVTFSMD